MRLNADSVVGEIARLAEFTGAATTSVTMLEANTNGIKWFGAIVSGYAAGTLTVNLKGFSNI